MPEIVDTVASARALAERILTQRERPLVVVSTAFDRPDSDIDAAYIESELGSLADVVLLTTGSVSRVVDELLPDRLQVFGGAGRSYPIDIGRDPDIRRSPLRFPAGGGRQATEQLIADASAQAYAAGAFRAAKVVPATTSGTVLGTAAGRGVVRLADGGVASIWHETLWPEVPLEWVLHAGLVVSGHVDVASGRFDVVRPSVSDAIVEAAFPHRSVTLALVVSVTDTAAMLAVHPDLPVQITRSDVSPNDHDRLTLLLSDGEVLPVRVLHLQGGVIHFQLSDVDDDEPVLPALSLLSGGEPWLRDGRQLREPAVVDVELEPEPAPAPAPASEPEPILEPEPQSESVLPPAPASARAAEPVPAPEPEPARRTALHDTQLALAAAKLRIAALEAQLAEVGADDSTHARLRDEARLQQRIAAQVKVELAESLQEAAKLKAVLSDARRALRSNARAAGSVAAPSGPSRGERRARWSDDKQWLRHEIYLAWVDRVEPSERARWPLPAEYRMSDRLAPSLAELDDGQFEKALKAIVDVLTGRVREIAARELHPLRTGDAGNAPAYVRHDGARCFRVYIEQNTPAARRLHFWQPPSGPLELERVVSHDEMDP